jgi:predicted MFS family arabinose efflux permease
MLDERRYLWDNRRSYYKRRKKVSDHRRIMQTLIYSNLALMFGFQVWRAVFNNLAVEELGLEAGAMGALQAIREIPGLLGVVFVLMVALLGSEMRVMGVNVILLGVGVIWSGLAQDYTGFVLGTLVASVGFHYFYNGSQAVLLQVTAQAETPRALGRFSSVSALASVLATVGVFAAALVLDNRQIMVVGGVIVVIAGLALLPRMNVARRYDYQDTPARESVRRDYWLYYTLTFLMGTRRHIFTTFAIFMLVRVHGLQTWQTAILFFVNSVVSFFVLPQLGRLVGVFGERRVLTFNFLCLTGIFVGYATIDAPMILIVLFVLDNIFFGFNLAINSYFQKIAVIPQDITPNMALGNSINHVAAVMIPIIGGWMWETFDPALPFLSGAVVAVISLALMYWMQVPHREAAWEPAG